MGEYENSAEKAAEKIKAARENSKENNKAIVVRFFIVIVISTLIGLIIGMLVGNNGESLQSMLADLGIFLKLNTCYLAAVVNVMMAVIGFAIYGKAESLSKKWDGDDDDLIEKIEDKLYYTVAIASVMTVLNFLAFGISLCAMSLGTEYRSQILYAGIISLITIVFGFIWTVALQGKIIELEKKLNPEKRGNVLDFKFQKKWLESCDEAEKMAVYKSSYDVFKISTHVYIVAWVVALLADSICNTGIFPVVMVSVMWLIQVVVYMTSARKYGK